ncbi:MAG: helix-turn-helix transcriptional regulator [Trichocoleus desertorum ATA4-8-CV12]|jgi:hypothetical protein|nr:helix-turn-helix transcriptional regulator [Trichocoleus desertorum ATA4-8-CV12]
MKLTIPISIWDDLNDRQQSYLEVIYQLDQETEREEKQRAFAGQRSPAAEWRWLLYGEVARNKSSRLKELLKKAGLVDPGTGSTFQALERRKLVECDGEVPELEIKLTPLGRKAVRAGLGEILPKRTPKGMLSELAWEALVLAYCAGHEGLKQEWGFRYAGIHFNAWDRLQDYREGALVKEVSHPEDFNLPSPGANRMHITSLGTEFYRSHWERYWSLYPDIEAPKPSQNEPDLIHSLPVDIATLVRAKRGERGLRETADEIGGGVSPSRLSRIEHGKKTDPSTLELVCNWLGVPMPENMLILKQS